MIYCLNCKAHVSPRTAVEKQILCYCPTCLTLMGSIEIPAIWSQPVVQKQAESIPEPVETPAPPKKVTKSSGPRTSKKATE